MRRFLVALIVLGHLAALQIWWHIFPPLPRIRALKYGKTVIAVIPAISHQCERARKCSIVSFLPLIASNSTHEHFFVFLSNASLAHRDIPLNKLLLSMVSVILLGACASLILLTFCVLVYAVIYTISFTFLSNASLAHWVLSLNELLLSIISAVLIRACAGLILIAFCVLFHTIAFTNISLYFC